MRAWAKVALFLLPILWLASPCAAFTVRIEGTAPLADHSEASIKAAIVAAIRTAAEGALTNGFPWVALGEVHVQENQVSVELFATDEDPGRAPGGAEPTAVHPNAFP